MVKEAKDATIRPALHGRGRYELKGLKPLIAGRKQQS